MDKINNLIRKLVRICLKKEIISYLIVGVLTTIINIVIYHLLCNTLGMENLLANAVAWFAAVIFAYITNNKFVFPSEPGTISERFSKISKFFAARIFSFWVDEAGMFLFVDMMGMNNIFIKIIMNIIVIVVNYVLSKFYIFTNKGETDGN